MALQTKEDDLIAFELYWKIMSVTLFDLKSAKRKLKLDLCFKREINSALIDIHLSLHRIQEIIKDNIKMAPKKKHPGFKNASKEIQKKEGISKDKADKILASSSRNASKKAKAKNPKLKKVKGK